jgi:hypothetical protein
LDIIEEDIRELRGRFSTTASASTPVQYDDSELISSLKRLNAEVRKAENLVFLLELLVLKVKNYWLDATMWYWRERFYPEKKTSYSSVNLSRTRRDKEWKIASYPAYTPSAFNMYVSLFQRNVEFQRRQVKVFQVPWVDVSYSPWFKPVDKIVKSSSTFAAVTGVFVESFGAGGHFSFASNTADNPNWKKYLYWGPMAYSASSLYDRGSCRNQAILVRSLSTDIYPKIHNMGRREVYDHWYFTNASGAGTSLVQVSLAGGYVKKQVVQDPFGAITNAYLYSLPTEDPDIVDKEYIEELDYVGSGAYKGFLNDAFFVRNPSYQKSPLYFNGSSFTIVPYFNRAAVSRRITHTFGSASPRASVAVNVFFSKRVKMCDEQKNDILRYNK